MLKRSFAPQAFTLIELLVVVLIISILAAIAVPNFLEAQTRAKVARVKSDLRTLDMAIETYRVDRNVPPHVAGLIDPYGQIIEPCEKFTDPDSTDPPPKQCEMGGVCLLTNLTTPIAYLTSVAIADPLCPTTKHDAFGIIEKPVREIQEKPFGIFIPYYYTPFYINIYGATKGWSRQIDPETGFGPYGEDEHYATYALVSLGPDYIKGPNPLVFADLPWAMTLYTYPDIHHYGDYQGVFKTRLKINQFTNDFLLWQYDPTNGTRSAGDIFRWNPTEPERHRNASAASISTAEIIKGKIVEFLFQLINVG